MGFDAVIFDLDGTLWDSSEIVSHSWCEVLRRRGLSVTQADIRGIMGLQHLEIKKKLFPQLSAAEADELMMSCVEYECRMIRQQGGVLFAKLEETLLVLSEKMPLFIVSNCQPGYIEAFLGYHRFSALFRDFQFAGKLGRTKGQNIRLVMERNRLQRPVYVGDTQMDRDAAGEAGIPFIHAAYGFGRVTDCAASLSSFDELPAVLEKLEAHL